MANYLSNDISPYSTTGNRTSDTSYGLGDIPTFSTPNWSPGNTSFGDTPTNNNFSGFNIPSNLFPTSYSGMNQANTNRVGQFANQYLMPWGNQLNTAIGQLGTTSPWSTAASNLQPQMETSLANLQNMPQYINQWRQAQGDQWLAGMDKMKNIYQPTMESMNQRGILNSDITGRALQGVQSDLNRQYGQVLEGANSMAAQMNMQNLQAQPGIYGNAMNTYQQQNLADLQRQQAYANAAQQGLGTMGTMLGNTRYSSYENPWQPWANMLPYMFGY